MIRVPHLRHRLLRVSFTGEALQGEAQITQTSSSPAPLPQTDITSIASGPPLLIDAGVEFDDYLILKKIGQGGMGSVFLAQQKSLGRQVAIKVLPSHLGEDEGFRRRFELEAQAVAQLSSPYIIQVFGLGVFHGQHYFVMEFIEGQDLGERLSRGERPNDNQAIDLVLQAAKGLAAAGKKGLIHRDIKPSNMMVTDDLELKLMDFGLVKQTDDVKGLTMTGTVMGTVQYFSPEQGRGEACDQRTDIYALGIVFYELLTGTLPFSGSNPSSIIYQHNHSEPRLPREIRPDIDERFQAIILKCLQKQVDDRYATAADLVVDLERVKLGTNPPTAFLHPEALRTGATMGKADPFAVESGTQAGNKSGSGIKLFIAAVIVLGLGGGGWWYSQKYLPQQEANQSSSRENHANADRLPNSGESKTNIMVKVMLKVL